MKFVRKIFRADAYFVLLPGAFSSPDASVCFGKRLTAIFR